MQVAAVFSFFDDSVGVARRRHDDVITPGPRDTRRRFAAHATRQLYEVRLVRACCQSRRGFVGVQPLGPLCRYSQLTSSQVTFTASRSELLYTTGLRELVFNFYAEVINIQCCRVPLTLQFFYARQHLYATARICQANSVCLSVRHTRVLYQNG